MKKILAIDDQQDNLTSVEAVIKINLPECKVFTALSGKEGIKLAKKEQPDVILLDIIMPIMDGFEVCTRLKSDELTKHIPVVMITAIKTDPKSRIRGLNLGADAFLPKPIDAVELSAQVNVMLRIKEAEDKLRAEKTSLDQEVKDSEYLLNRSQQVAALGSYVFDLQNDTWESSSILDDIFGIDKDFKRSLSGWLPIIHPDDRAEMQKYFTVNVLTNHEAFNKEYRIKRIKDQQERWVHGLGELEFSDDGAAIRVIGTIQDITERKRVEIALQESESKYKSLFEKSEDAVLIISDGLFVDCNRATVKMLNYNDKKDLLETHPSQLSPEKQPDGRMSFEKAEEMMSIAKQKGSNRFEWDHKKVGGEVFPVEVLLTHIPSIGGKTIIHTVWRDISERKKGEKTQQILYSISNAVNATTSLDELFQFIKDELHQIIDTTNFFIALWDGESDTVSVPYIVDKTDRFTSLPMKGSLTGHVIKTEQSLLATKEVFERLQEEGKAETIGGESKIWVGVPMRSKGLVNGALVVQSYDDDQAFTPTDVEILEFVSGQVSLSIERKTAEEELKRTFLQAMEADRLKSAFLATMSHELRTPLNAVIGFSQLLDKESSGEEVEEFAGRINKSGGHLLEIIEDIFDITLIETGDIKLFKDEQDIIPLMEDVLGVIKTNQKKLDKPDIDIRISPANRIKHLPLFTDHRRLKQILINLMSNALKFTDKGNIELGFEEKIHQNQPVLQFFVRDTGIGIPKEKQELIFDVFRQVDDTHTRRHGGTGIGLSIVKRLTELLGGTIWIESDEGRGSAFYFTIPYEKQEVLSKQPVDQPKKKPSLKGKTILIVEDVESSYNFLDVILGKSGVVSIWAKDGMEAINFCKENKNIDLVLMDINMPVMNGYDSTKEIKKIRPKLPVIAQTAYAIAGDMEKSLAAGCDDYISKPINRKLLMEIVEKWMR